MPARFTALAPRGVSILLGEFVHRTTLDMRANGTSIFEKAFILFFSPTHLVQQGWNRP